MGYLDQQECFAALKALLQSYPGLDDYVFHVRLDKEKSDSSVYQAIFSKPSPTKPVPEHVANVNFTVHQPKEGESEPRIAYAVEQQQQQIPGAIPIRKSWLDSVHRRKTMVLAATKQFAEKGSLPLGRAFVPGEYKAGDAIYATALDGADDNELRLMEAVDDLADAQEVAMRNTTESAEELEALLVGIFKDADADGNGYLDPSEFAVLLDTAELELESSEKRQLMMLCDANGDGKIEYAEFAPFGADIVQTMRVRKLHAQESALREEVAEQHARETLHGMGEAEVSAAMLAAFTEFDADGSGVLEREEFKGCLEALTLGATRLTAREVRFILGFVDEDCSGSVEYNEFAPLMFNWMVEALKLGFLESERSGLEAYLMQHLRSYDGDDSGTLSRKALKRALCEADLLGLTPVQVHTVLASAAEDGEGRVDYAAFAPSAAQLIGKMVDPTLEHKRLAVSKMATVTPLGALTPAEVGRLQGIALGAFQKYDANGSGKLDRVEFHKCLVESQLGFSERQVAHLMSAADDDDDGAIDYAEFSSLFHGVILELARADAVEKLLVSDEEKALIALRGAVAATAMALLDELMIPLHIAFDIGAEGADASDADVVVATLTTKAAEWGLPDEGVSAICAMLGQRGGPVEWGALVEVLEQAVLVADAQDTPSGA